MAEEVGACEVLHAALGFPAPSGALEVTFSFR